MNTTATPQASEQPPAGSPASHLGGLSHLFAFVSAALLLMIALPNLAVAVALPVLLQKNPGLTPGQALDQLRFNAFFVVPVQVVTSALLVLLIYVFVRRRALPFWKSLALRPLNPLHLLPLLLGGGLLALLVVFASALVPPPEKLPFDKLFSSQSAAWLIIGLALLLAPIVEEMVFRGYIYTLLETRFGMAPAVLVSGLLFGLWHFPQYYPGYFQMFLICVVGLAFSLVRAGSRTLLASILAHFAYNATVSLHFLASEQFRSLPALFF